MNEQNATKKTNGSFQRQSRNRAILFWLAIVLVVTALYTLLIQLFIALL